jgi:hypothetical protein
MIHSYITREKDKLSLSFAGMLWQAENASFRMELFGVSH